MKHTAFICLIISCLISFSALSQKSGISATGLYTIALDHNSSLYQLDKNSMAGWIATLSKYNENDYVLNQLTTKRSDLGGSDMGIAISSLDRNSYKYIHTELQLKDKNSFQHLNSGSLSFYKGSFDKENHYGNSAVVTVGKNQESMEDSKGGYHFIYSVLIGGAVGALSSIIINKSNGLPTFDNVGQGAFFGLFAGGAVHLLVVNL